MSKLAIITGATSGIGLATAQLLASQGYNLIITGRREELLHQKAKEIQATIQCEVTCLVFDVRNNSEVSTAFTTHLKGKCVDVLVNNAGLAVGLSSVANGDIDDWDRMIDTNVKGLLYVSKAVIPFMKEMGRGTIINVGSIASRNVYPYGNVYCATKHAVDALTQAMRIELLKLGVRVGAVHPGFVDTEFSTVRFKGDKVAADKVYDGMTALQAQDIADAIAFMVSRPPHVTINDMLIMPTVQANIHYLERMTID